MNKTVLITGASHGIGKACAILFAENDYNVVINYNKSASAAKELCDWLISSGFSAATIKADVSSSKEVKEMFKSAEAVFGGIDILVNNAGISLIKVINDVSESEWNEILDVNTKSAFLCSKCALEHMLRKKSGRIINISSMWGITGASCEVPYSASKAAIIGFTKALSKELAPSGITVNCVCPGIIDTAMNSHLSQEELDNFVSEVPLMRIGKPEEVAHAVLFLASEGSSYITGQVLSIDGGITI